MGCIKRLLAAGIIVLLLGVFFSQLYPWQVSARALAANPTPQPKKRITKLSVQYIRYEWWLIRWSNNTTECQLFIDHPGLPTSAEIFKQCTARANGHWLETGPCDQADQIGDTSSCTGSYLHLVNVDDSEHQVEVELPLPQVWVSISDCNPVPENHACTTLPNLLLQADEPLPNENIIQIQGTINWQVFNCPGSQCILPLSTTGLQGQKMEFWADSSLGDTSEHFTAMLRVMPWGDFANPEAPSNDPALWYVDVLSSQWRGGSVDNCANSWQVFPDLGGPPAWLRTSDKVEDLQTQQSYYLLTGTLIKNGIVDASACPDGGMANNQIPSTCGLEKAKPKVIEWQNRFDPEILKAAQDTGVPAQLIKNMFSRESQFWPGEFTGIKEAGLGQLTENGADTVLLWNPDFFAQFCPLMLDKSVCDYGFSNLLPEHQAILRGALVSKVNASCADCPMGIDLTRANFSVRVFAESMRANCEQTGQIIYNITRRSPGQVSSFVDLWRFTILNYNAGPGCAYTAMKAAWLSCNGKLTWSQVAGKLEPVCQAAIPYLEDVSQEVLPTPAITATATVTPTPTATATPERSTPTFGPYPTATEDKGAYPPP